MNQPNYIKRAKEYQQFKQLYLIDTQFNENITLFVLSKKEAVNRGMNAFDQFNFEGVDGVISDPKKNKSSGKSKELSYENYQEAKSLSDGKDYVIGFKIEEPGFLQLFNLGCEGNPERIYPKNHPQQIIDPGRVYFISDNGLTPDPNEADAYTFRNKGVSDVLEILVAVQTEEEKVLNTSDLFPEWSENQTRGPIGVVKGFMDSPPATTHWGWLEFKV